MWSHAWHQLSPYIDLLRGAILVAPDIGDSPGFDDYMRNQNLLSDPNNPWFREFWQNYFQCNLEYNAGYITPCSGKESMANASYSFSDRQSVIATINAVYSYAKGLTTMFTDLCGHLDLPPCKEMKGEPNRLNYVNYKTLQNANTFM